MNTKTYLNLLAILTSLPLFCLINQNSQADNKCKYKPNLVMCIVQLEGKAHVSRGNVDGPDIDPFTIAERSKFVPIFNGDSFWLDRTSRAMIVSASVPKNLDVKVLSNKQLLKAIMKAIKGPEFETKKSYVRIDDSQTDKQFIRKFERATRVAGIHKGPESEVKPFVANIEDLGESEGEELILILRNLAPGQTIKIQTDARTLVQIPAEELIRSFGGSAIGMIRLQRALFESDSVNLTFVQSSSDNSSVIKFKHSFRAIPSQPSFGGDDFSSSVPTDERWIEIANKLDELGMHRERTAALSSLLKALKASYPTYSALSSDPTALATLTDVAELFGLSPKEAVQLFNQGQIKTIQPE